MILPKNTQGAQGSFYSLGTKKVKTKGRKKGAVPDLCQ